MKLSKVIAMNRHNPLFRFWAPFILSVLEFHFYWKDILDMGLPFLLTGPQSAQLGLADSVFDPLASKEGPL